MVTAKALHHYFAGSPLSLFNYDKIFTFFPFFEKESKMIERKEEPKGVVFFEHKQQQIYYFVFVLIQEKYCQERLVLNF